MSKRAVSNMRQRSPWLALAVSFAVVVGTVVPTLLWPSGSLALDAGSEDPALVLSTETQTPQGCGQCHPDEFRGWSDSTHAAALFDPIFQTYLQQVQQPGECLGCHTTGYDAATGQFVLAGVTCEACHGPYRPQHPEESMTIAASADMCGSCHRSTLSEWQTSRHGMIGVSCVDCHEVHSQQTRAAASTNTLCANCHQDEIQNLTHVVHNRVGVLCVDCHLARPEDDGSGAISGQAVTGHSFTVLVSTCSGCHVAFEFLNGQPSTN